MLKNEPSPQFKLRLLVSTLLLLSFLLVGCVEASEKKYTYTGKIVKVFAEENLDLQSVLFEGDSTYTSFHHTALLEFGKCYTITSWKKHPSWKNLKTSVEEIDCLK